MKSPRPSTISTTLKVLPPRARPARGRRGWLRTLGLALVLLLVAAAGLATWILVTLPDVRALATQNPRTTAFIELRRAEAAEAGKTLALRWTWRPIGRISKYLRYAVVRSEDPRFYDHEGIDWEAVEHAAKADWEARELKYGASTITQQVAKNLYLSPSKNPVRKLREWFIARRLEGELDKKRILEIYLNIAEWGPGVFGVEAAARHWFGVSAAELTPAQAARLAVALPNPFKRSPKVASGKLDRKAAQLVRGMRGARLVDDAGLATALAALGQGPSTPTPPAPADAPPPPIPPADSP